MNYMETFNDKIDFVSKEMIFNPELNNVPSPEFRTLLKKWQDIKTDTHLPSRHDFPPQEMVACLPNIILLDVIKNDPEEIPRFKFRLVGTTITHTFRQDLTGKYIDETNYDQISNIRLNECVKSKSPYLMLEKGTRCLTKTLKVFNILSLPLSSDGKEVDKILILMKMVKA